MKAWLITWDWTDDAVALADRIAGVLDFRFSEDRVARTVEFLYARERSTVQELVSYARARKNNPYTAQVERNAQIFCGHNPSLWARRVKDLEVTTSPDGFEEVSWVELPIYRYGEEGVVRIRGELPQRTVRQKKGPLSSEHIWDPLSGRFKSGWGPEKR